MKKTHYIPFMVAIAIFIVSLTYSDFILPYWIKLFGEPSTGEQGTFGDSFGVLNSVFSGLAFTALIWTIVLQREDNANASKEMERQHEEMERQHEEMMMSNFETTFFGLMEMKSRILENMEIVIPRRRRLFSCYANPSRLYGETLEKFEKDAVITRLLSLLLERLDSGCKIISNDDFDKIYKTFYEEHDNILSRYHKTLYQVVNFVNDHVVSDDKTAQAEKLTKYSRYIRAQLSSDEVAFLTYHCLSYIGRPKFMPLINKFKLLEHHPNGKYFSYVSALLYQIEDAFSNNEHYLVHKRNPRQMNTTGQSLPVSTD